VTSGSKHLPVDLRTERMATGGEAVARLDDGRVVFVLGALADETVRVEIVEEKKRFARGVVIDVVEPSPHRVAPSCSHAVSGECGGCDWMHIRPDEQRSYKEAVVVEQLQRLGGVERPDVVSPVFQRGRRTTVRCQVTHGRAGYRARRSDQSFVADECGAVDSRLEELLVNGRFGDATEITLRIGGATGERMVITNGAVDMVLVPDDVVVASADDPASSAIHDVVAGKTWRVSARSFFQTSHAGAEALVAAVARRLGQSEGSVLDLYSGVGLLGGGAAGDRLRCAVESNPSSVDDARHNLGPDVQVVQSRVERWSPTTFSTVIADPARRGLGKDGVSVLEGTSASRLVLVSCDPASLGRDTGLLAERGWVHEGSEVLDMFPDTSRIEVASSFTR
jgi:23S rRNA (uracil1939-C5)-methyltransferase